MHIVLMTYGSRGDVEPFAALGRGLQAAGHSVRLAAPEAFGPLVRSARLEHIPLPGDPDQLVAGLVQRAGRNPLRMVQVMSRYVLPLAAEVFARVREGCQGADLIVHSFLLTDAGNEIAAQMGIPDLSAQLFPVFSPTREFPAAAFPDLFPAGPLAGPYRRLSHTITIQTFRRGGRFLYGRVRKSHAHLPALSGWAFSPRDGRPATPLLYGFSPHVVPRPGDWDDRTQISGYWFLHPAGGSGPGGAPAPEPELAAFVEAGPPPVYVGFGSTVVRDARRLADIALQALARTGQRGVVVLDRDKPSPGDLPENVHAAGTTAHAWLFPRMAAVVHHGGAGTTGAGLRAGVPNVVVPFTSDQPFWGRRVFDLGAGPKPIPATRLTTEKLAAAIEEAVGSAEMRDRAELLGECIRGEDGVGRAVALIEQAAHGYGRPAPDAA